MYLALEPRLVLHIGDPQAGDTFLPLAGPLETEDGWAEAAIERLKGSGQVASFRNCSRPRNLAFLTSPRPIVGPDGPPSEIANVFRHNTAFCHQTSMCNDPLGHMTGCSMKRQPGTAVFRMWRPKTIRKICAPSSMPALESDSLCCGC